MSSKLYVGNLSFDTGEQELQELFSSHGEVISANVITDRETGRPRGFGFVEMSQAEDAQKAIQSLDGQEFMGRNLKVNLAKPREDRGGGGGGGRGGGGGGRGRDGW
jgi:RNA recognition motif-containing protein